MGGGSKPNSAVRGMFGYWEKEWRNAYEEWKKRCKGMSEQLHTLEQSGGLVAQAARDPSAPRADVEPQGARGLKADVAERIDILRDADARCAKSMKLLQQTLKRLEEAQHTGVWSTDAKVFGVKRDPKFVSPILRHVSRGESVVVIDKQGEWVKVRAQAGEEGWVHMGEIKPQPPTMLWKAKDAAPRRPAGMSDEEWEKTWWDQENDGRNLMSGRG